MATKSTAQRQLEQSFLLVAACKAKAMADAFGLTKIYDYLHRCQKLSGHPVWLLGICYSNGDKTQVKKLENEVLKDLMDRFKSIIYMSYRSGFIPTEDQKLTTDFGWGCAIRSGQMLMAQALTAHLRAADSSGKDIPANSRPWEKDVVSLFWDNPSIQYTFSIHRICQEARTLGSRAGNWMTPGLVIRILSKICNLHTPFGLKTAVIAHPDGAPFLTPARIQEYLDLFHVQSPKSETGKRSKKGKDLTGHHNRSGPTISSETRLGLVLFLPLLLGVETIDSRYLDQLKAIMKWPYFLGFVGGEKNSSFYFVGFQEDSVLYLDPHTVQAMTKNPGLLKTHRDSPIRQAHITTIISTLSLGFYCASEDCLLDLIERFRQLEKCAGEAPILTFISNDVKTTGIRSGGERCCSSPEVDLATAADGDLSDEWQIIDHHFPAGAKSVTQSG